MEAVTNDLLIKIALMFISAAITCMGVILVWGFQKLITTLLEHSQDLLKISTRLGLIEKSVAPVEKMGFDLNNYYRRLKNVEGKLNIKGET